MTPIFLVNGTKRRAAVVFCAVLLAGCGRDSPDTLVKSAREFLAKGDSNAAVIQLRNALQKAPDNAEARYLLGTSLLERRDPAGAVKELRTAQQLGFAQDQVVPALARAMLDDGDAKELVSEFGEVKLASPDGQAALKATIGDALRSLGKPAEAEAAYTEAVAAKPDFPKALLGLATLRAGKGDLTGAEKIVDELLARSPAPAEAYVMKARFLAANNQRDAAVAILKKALEARSDYLPARYDLVSLLIGKGDLDEATAQIGAIRKLSKQDSFAYYFEAFIAARRGNLAAAREAIQQVLKVAPGYVPGLALAGEIEYRSKQFNQAEDYLQRALKGAPNSSYVQRLLAATYLRLGNPTRAVEVLRQPLGRGSKDPQLMAVAGEAYLALGDFTKAAEYFAQTAAMEPDNAAVRTRLGQVRFAEGDNEGAIRDLEAASALDPNVSQADLALIANLIRNKQLDEALASVVRLEEKQPNSPLVYNLKGFVYLARHDLDGARANFERALQIQSDYLPAVANLAQLDRMQNRPDMARKHYDKVLEKEPNNEQALVGLANLLQSMGGDPNEIEALLKKAVAANPQALDARAALVNFYLRKRDGKQALSVAQEANAALPSDPLTLDLLGQVQLATGDPSLAVATFTKLVAARPGVVEPLVRLAQALVAAKEYDRAVDRLREALKINPDFFDASRDIVMIYAKSGRPDQAMEEVKSLQSRKPNDVRGYVLEGDLWAAEHKWREAEAALKLAQKRAPDDGRVAAQLHAVVTEAGNGAQADAAAEKWLRGHPKDVVMHSYLGELALRKPDYKAAARHFEALVALQPNNVVFLNNLAWVSGELGDPKALPYAEKAATLSPANPNVLDTYGMLLIKKGDMASGVEKLRKAAQLAPTQGDIHLHLAEALIKTGDKAGARIELDALAQAASAPAQPAADQKGKNAQGTSVPATTSKPTLKCSPDCQAQVSALLKTL